VAIAGFFIECNRWSPVTTAADFERSVDLSGDALDAQLRSERPRVLPDTVGFVAEMDRAGPWHAVPLRLAGAQPGGPVEHAYFESFLRDTATRLTQALPVDAVFLSLHGAALTTESEDPDGEWLACLRAIVGPQVPVVAVLDLHTNVSPQMTRALSGFVAYRTNPHQDLHARGEEAARLVQRFLREGPGEVSLVKLPLVPPATSQLIAPGSVYGELVEAAQAHGVDEVLNVSLCGGFALADSPKCGFSVVVTTRAGHRSQGERLARALAERVWAQGTASSPGSPPWTRRWRCACRRGRTETCPP
jgi:microcystin degradation protein MlrC